MDSMILLVAMIAVFYFLIIRPENKRKKQAENMRNSLKKGERITTIGGLVGRIVQVNDATVVFAKVWTNFPTLLGMSSQTGLSSNGLFVTST